MGGIMEESRRKRRSPPEGSHDTLATVRCQRTHATLTLSRRRDSRRSRRTDAGRAAGGDLDAACVDSDEYDGAPPRGRCHREAHESRSITSPGEDGRRSRKDGSMKNVQLTVE